MPSMSDFSTAELKDDRAGCSFDIRICETALAQGITEYGNKQSVFDRMETNKAIIAIIEEELKKREGEAQ